MIDGITSGSGCVELVPLERGYQGGSNDTNYSVAVAVLTELRWSENRHRYKNDVSKQLHAV
jgi:hypothetical protein